MKCPKCNSTSHRKNGHRRGKQCYQCCVCGRQFVESPLPKSYPLEVKQLCLKMYLNGMGLRGIERVTEIHHTTIMNWSEEAGMELPDTPEEGEIREITEIDELQTFIGNKNKKVWIWTVVNHWQAGILLWTVGARSSETFKHLWLTINGTFRLTKQQKLCIVRDTALLSQSFTGYKLGKHPLDSFFASLLILMLSKPYLTVLTGICPKIFNLGQS